MALTNEYELDSADNIVRVSDGWDDFAMQNDGSGAIASRILGRNLWSFVCGDTTRMWLEVLLQLARTTGRQVTRSYRCDSPTVKRFMEMTVFPQKDRGLILTHDLVFVEAMAVSVKLRHTPAGPACFRCDECNCINVNGRWLEPDVADVSRYNRSGIISVRDTICPACRQREQVFA